MTERQQHADKDYSTRIGGLMFLGCRSSRVQLRRKMGLLRWTPLFGDFQTPSLVEMEWMAGIASKVNGDEVSRPKIEPNSATTGKVVQRRETQ